jgi:hypothetical protein
MWLAQRMPHGFPKPYGWLRHNGYLCAPKSATDLNAPSNTLVDSNIRTYTAVVDGSFGHLQLIL